ncbi:hypothetical protein Fmac_010468 [Flemingia macrophylla]|uniref:Uncharacterized protein n=1 Tax=Flemingia macrophylla TaxID=520843 RepID=A0ABD1MJQ1_9FABA
MSGGIQDVRAEDVTAINTESGIRIMTAVGRGGYVKDIYVKRMSMHTMKWAFSMTGNYGSYADTDFDPKALPQIRGINYRDVVAENVAMAATLEGVSNSPFTGICIANVTISIAAKANEQPWTCTDVEGITSGIEVEVEEEAPPVNGFVPLEVEDEALAVPPFVGGLWTGDKICWIYLAVNVFVHIRVVRDSVVSFEHLELEELEKPTNRDTDTDDD